MTEMHSIQIGYRNSYVHNRPFEGTKGDYGDKELLGLSTDTRDSLILESIKTKNQNVPEKLVRGMANKKPSSLLTAPGRRLAFASTHIKTKIKQKDKIKNT